MKIPDWVWAKRPSKPCAICGNPRTLYHANGKVFCKAHKIQAVHAGKRYA